MLSISSLTKSTIASGLLVVLIAVYGTLVVVTGQLTIPQALFLVAIVVLACGSVIFVRRAEGEIREAINLCKAIDKGDFEARIVNSSATGQMGDLHATLNNMVDRCDAFVREATASLEYVSRNQYFRKIIEKGMTGSFRNAAATVNCV